jgi:diketogulonate reductase-like aldo/keto reductase
MELQPDVIKRPSLKLNNGVEMPALGLGVYQSAPEDTLTAVKTALECGYRLIDTAAAYMNERQVGEAFRASGIERSEVFVTTKLWISDYGYDKTLHAFERSRRNLGLEYLDLYLLHWPVPKQFERTVESWKAAEKLLRDGRVRAIGICNASPKHLDDLVARTDVVPAVNQVELHPFFSQPELRAADARLGIVTQAWSPIGGVKRYSGENTASGDPLRHPVITGMAQKYGKTPAQVVLRWQIQLGNSAVPKSVHSERIRENGDIFDFKLQADEMKAISTLDTGRRGGPDPNQVDPQMFSFQIPD